MDELRAKVVTLDHVRFENACAELMGNVARSGMPDVLIGIRTGGLVVAEAMAAVAKPRLPVLAVTCRRTTSRAKGRIGGLRQVLTRMPRPVLDELRVIEHMVLTRLAKKSTGRRELDANDLGALRRGLAALPEVSDIVIVDDAVDSGATLELVFRTVRDMASAARLRSAAITITTEHPVLRPDHALYDRVLCRFPWSFDFEPERQC